MEQGHSQKRAKDITQTSLTVENEMLPICAIPFLGNRQPTTTTPPPPPAGEL
jgi:hypothetical protein